MLKAPFIWFGGKSKVAHIVWDALGDVINYIEPFAGSLAVLLGRPAGSSNTCETVNDKDMFLANFWRAVSHDPVQVAHWADWPVNEADLSARHRWLIAEAPARLKGIEINPDLYDAQIAGWWLWGICAWIGAEWCQKPTSQLPHLGTEGQGIHRKSLNAGDLQDNITQYILDLQSRLRKVRVCCGDWKRVVTKGAMSYGLDTKSVGVFLDPPYSHDTGRDTTLYNEEMPDTKEIQDWCLQWQDQVRIVLCGYEGEYNLPGWDLINWKANGGYANNAKDKNVNKHKERIWISPLSDHKQGKLFGSAEGGCQVNGANPDTGLH